VNSADRFDVLTPGKGGGPGVSKSDRQLLTTLFASDAKSRRCSTWTNSTEAAALIARITDFHAMAVYLVDPKRGDLRIAYAGGLPYGSTAMRLALGEGLVGRAVQAGRPLLANDVADEPHYIEVVPGTRSELVVPMRRKGRAIGALNLLSRNLGEFTPAEVETLRNFAARWRSPSKTPGSSSRSGATRHIETMAEISASSPAS